MAELVSSAVVQEAVNKIVSSVLHKYEGISSEEEHLERLEMAQIKLEAAVETSEKWHITEASLLRWQKKLKGAAQECADTLRKCRQHVQDQEEMQQEVKNSSFPKRIVHASKSLISSISCNNSKELNRSAVRRFEWFADGATEFLRYLELGGAPRCHTFFNPLVRHLLAGKTLDYKSVRGSKHHLIRISPLNIAKRTEARLIIQYKDSSAVEDNFFFALVLQLSESTDIIAVAIKCLQLFTPQFKYTAETVRKELTQLPMQDFSWVPCSYSYRTENWESIHNIRTKCLRPNPLCCKQQDLHKSCGGNIDMELSGTSLEPVVDVYLECHVSLSGYVKQRATRCRKLSSNEFPLLKLGLVFMPHGSSKEHLLPATESSLVEVINGEKQHCLHTNITLEQVSKVMLPNAIDCLHQDAEARSYQMLWKSRHGTAYLNAAKTSMQKATKRRTIRGERNGMMLQQQEEEPDCQTDDVCAFINLWAMYAPVQIQGSIMDWIHKEKEAQLAKNGNGYPEEYNPSES